MKRLKALIKKRRIIRSIEEVKRQIIRSIEEVKKGDKEKKIEAIDFLGNTIGDDAYLELKSDAIKVLEGASWDKSALVRKSAKKALELINTRRIANMQISSKVE